MPDKTTVCSKHEVKVAMLLTKEDMHHLELWCVSGMLQSMCVDTYHPVSDTGAAAPMAVVKQPCCFW